MINQCASIKTTTSSSISQAPNTTSYPDSTAIEQWRQIFARKLKKPCRKFSLCPVHRQTAGSVPTQFHVSGGGRGPPSPSHEKEKDHKPRRETVNLLKVVRTTLTYTKPTRRCEPSDRVFCS